MSNELKHETDCPHCLSKNTLISVHSTFYIGEDKLFKFASLTETYVCAHCNELTNADIIDLDSDTKFEFRSIQSPLSVKYDIDKPELVWTSQYLTIQEIVDILSNDHNLYAAEIIDPEGHVVSNNLF